MEESKEDYNETDRRTMAKWFNAQECQKLYKNGKIFAIICGDGIITEYDFNDKEAQNGDK